MILTFKIKHNQDYSLELSKAKQIAHFAIKNRDKLSSKYVKHIGLKSAISNQILRKYGKDKKCKIIKNVNLIIPSQGIKLNKDYKIIQIPCLNLIFNYQFHKDFIKINQIEINENWLFISVTVEEPELLNSNNWIGIDLNTTGYCAVIANPQTGKILKLGKEAQHIHRKYKCLRRKLSKRKSFKKLKSIKQRQSNKIKDLNHKISKSIINYAKENNSGIKLEKLKGIRKNTKKFNLFNYYLNSWSFYQLQKMIEYKAKLQGIIVTYIAPYMTSQTCSKCGLKGERINKKFICPKCGLENADINAAFNIALSPLLEEGVSHFKQERDCLKGSTDTPEV